ncbi:MAG: SRPBCC family protein [Kineosporiaceae bacterium]
MMRVQVATLIEAPRETVFAVYADYLDWPRVFPTIRGVRVVRRDGPRVVVQLDHLEGTVVNELVLHPPERIDLWEGKRHHDAVFVNRFEALPDGATRFSVTGEFRLKGWARLLRPVLPPYARRLMRRLQLEPVQRVALRRVADSAP